MTYIRQGTPVLLPVVTEKDSGIAQTWVLLPRPEKGHLLVDTNRLIVGTAQRVRLLEEYWKGSGSGTAGYYDPHKTARMANAAVALRAMDNPPVDKRGAIVAKMTKLVAEMAKLGKEFEQLDG